MISTPSVSVPPLEEKPSAASSGQASFPMVAYGGVKNAL
jgi:hypothetical protein